MWDVFMTCKSTIDLSELFGSQVTEGENFWSVVGNLNKYKLITEGFAVCTLNSK